MTAQQYFKHSRALGSFSAEDCISLAREAAKLDEISASKNIAPPSTVSREVIFDNGDTVTLSFAVKVF